MLYINGNYVSDDEGKISVLDLGLVRGYGVFDFLRTYHGRPFHLRDHLLRLQFSAGQIGMNLPNTLEEIEQIVENLLSQNNYKESSIKIIVTGGVSPDQITPLETGNLIVLMHPLKDMPRDHYLRGICATTTSLARTIPQAKTLQYIPAIVALQKGRSKNAIEALYLNSKNEILEATTSNFFAFDQSGTLITNASEEILFGITREVILKLAPAHFPVKIRPIFYDEISHLEEAFISSSTKEVMPLVQIDDHIIGSGKVGPRTQKLIELFAEYSQKGQWNHLQIPRYQPSVSMR